MRSGEVMWARAAARGPRSHDGADMIAGTAHRGRRRCWWSCPPRARTTLLVEWPGAVSRACSTDARALLPARLDTSAGLASGPMASFFVRSYY